MKRLIIGTLTLAIFAAPCIHDVFSLEPSPMIALARAVGLQG